jgi:hypothetical protein
VQRHRDGLAIKFRQGDLELRPVAQNNRPRPTASEQFSLAVKRPRVRSPEDKEVRLSSYEMFHRGQPLTETVWEKLMLGLSTRKYGEAVRQVTEAYGMAAALPQTCRRI